jgi:hypothetical protein
MNSTISVFMLSFSAQIAADSPARSSGRFDEFNNLSLHVEFLSSDRGRFSPLSQPGNLMNSTILVFMLSFSAQIAADSPARSSGRFDEFNNLRLHVEFLGSDCGRFSRSVIREI